MNEWEVQVFTSKRGDYEISVIKKDNKHGHDSWGWGGGDKIVLFDNSYVNTHGLDISDKEFMINVANALCIVMNKR